MAHSPASKSLTNTKQIESKIVALNINNTFAFTASFFSFVQPKLYTTHCHLTMTGDIDNVCCDPIDRAAVVTIWPKRMLEASDISITICLDDGKRQGLHHHSDFYAVFHFFSSLALFLVSSNSSKQQLKVKFLTSGPPVSNLLLPNILGPLDCFSPNPKVEPASVWTPRYATPDFEKE